MCHQAGEKQAPATALTCGAGELPKPDVIARAIIEPSLPTYGYDGDVDPIEEGDEIHGLLIN
jgi:hypothetical protein